MITHIRKIYKGNYFIPSMVRYRKINLYGARYVVELMKTDMTDLNLTVGDLVDLDDIVKKKIKKIEVEK